MKSKKFIYFSLETKLNLLIHSLMLDVESAARYMNKSLAWLFVVFKLLLLLLLDWSACINWTFSLFFLIVVRKFYFKCLLFNILLITSFFVLEQRFYSLRKPRKSWFFFHETKFMKIVFFFYKVYYLFLNDIIKRVRVRVLNINPLRFTLRPLFFPGFILGLNYKVIKYAN